MPRPKQVHSNNANRWNCRKSPFSKTDLWKVGQKHWKASCFCVLGNIL